MTNTHVSPAGELVTLDDLVRRYSEVLRRFFHKRILENADIDDLVQEVFLRLTRRGVSDIAYIEGYIFQAAANVLRDRIRHRVAHKLDRQQPLEEDYAQDVAFSPERVLLGKEAVLALTMALQELPERTRTIFILSRFEELYNADIAKRLGISVSAVEKHMTKALAYLSARTKELP